MELQGYINGGYATCQVKMRGNRMTYISHDSGAKSRWMQVIKHINEGDTHPSYVTSAGDCFAVTINA